MLFIFNHIWTNCGYCWRLYEILVNFHNLYNLNSTISCVCTHSRSGQHDPAGVAWPWPWPSQRPGEHVMWHADGSSERAATDPHAGSLPLPLYPQGHQQVFPGQWMNTPKIGYGCPNGWIEKGFTFKSPLIRWLRTGYGCLNSGVNNDLIHKGPLIGTTVKDMLKVLCRKCVMVE